MATNKFIITQQREKCIGCGSCTMYSPDCWKINNKDGKADLIGGIKKGKVIVAEVGMEHLEDNKKAAKACPMQIIKLNK